MTFDYNQSIWGRGTATASVGSPTAVRLRRALLALAGLPPGTAVVELGCGAGQFIRAIKKLCPKLECHGSDISARALASAAAAPDGVTYTLGSAEQFPFPDQRFDAVLIFDVLEHVTNPRTWLTEVWRILKPGGRIYCFVPCEGDPLSLWYWWRRFKLGPDFTRQYAGHINYWSRRSLYVLFGEVGFTVKSVSYSEHAAGQLLNLVAFILTNRAAKKHGFSQLNNEECCRGLPQTGPLGWLRKLANLIVYLESAILKRVPSPNVHLVAERPR